MQVSKRKTYYDQLACSRPSYGLFSQNRFERHNRCYLVWR